MANKNTTSENSIEKYFLRKCKEAGMRPMKMLPTFESGVPDRIVLFRGCSGFAELKRPGKEPRHLQISFLKELGKAGSFVGVVDSKESALAWISDFLDHVEEITGDPIV
jgi:hypothetical protein